MRGALRRFLDDADAEGLLESGQIAVAVSGGADSLALAALTAPLAAKRGLRTHGLVVDHGLQEGSGQVSERAASQLRALGLDAIRVLPVTVGGRGGIEAAARYARYAALREAQPAPGSLVLLGHTCDDQAETVLLGLGRGSGPRSIAGMQPVDPPWGRPLLGVSRAATEAVCEALGLKVWSDPHNADPGFARVRLRTEVLPLLDEVLQGGVRGALARTATQLREDLDVLDELGEQLHASAETADGELDAGVLEAAPPPLRRRVLRRWLLGAGVKELSDAQIRCVDELVGDWRGQGGVWLPGNLVATRAHGTLTVDRAERRAPR